MAILQVHQAKVLKQVYEGSTDPGLMQELRTATDFALRAMKVTARSLGKAMSTMVVQERHLWLNLAEVKYVDKGTLFRRPGDTVEGFAQQFSAVQQQTEAIQLILPRRDAPSTAAPGARPQSARRLSLGVLPPSVSGRHRGSVGGGCPRRPRWGGRVAVRGGDSGRAPGPSRGSPQLRPASGPPSRCSPPLPREAAGGSGAGGLPGA